MINTPVKLSQEEYIQKWTETQQKLAQQGFTWATLFEEDEWHQYMSLDSLKMSAEEIAHIKEITQEFKVIIQKTYDAVMKDGVYFRKLGLPIETYEIASKYNPYLFSYFCRFDLIKANNGTYKFIEINSDTPTGYLESSVVNKELCEQNELTNHNHLEASITQAWEEAIFNYMINSYDTIHFTSYGWHEEDKQTVLFNMKHCDHENKQYIPIEDIVIADDGVYTPEGEKIKFLYRLYPIEYLPYDEDENGRKIGNILLNHVAERNLHIINPPSAFVTQTKAFLAAMYEFAENDDVFNEEEKQFIFTHVPRTYFEKDKFIEEDAAYVSKPLFGREGGGVTITDRGEILDQDTTPEYYEQRKIYQEYIEMPDLTISTWDGEYTGKLLIGSFLIGGESAGLFARVGEKITGNLSMFIGVGSE